MPAPAKDLTHEHRCDCGTYLVCKQPHDQCAVADPYLCPSCEQQRLDDYLTSHEPQPILEGADHERF